MVPQPDYVRGPFKVYLRSDGIYSVRDETKSFGASAESTHTTLREATAATDGMWQRLLATKGIPDPYAKTVDEQVATIEARRWEERPAMPTGIGPQNVTLTYQGLEPSVQCRLNEPLNEALNEEEGLLGLAEVQEETGIETVLPDDYSAELARVEARLDTTGHYRNDIPIEMAGDMPDHLGLMSGFDATIAAVKGKVENVVEPQEEPPKADGWEDEEPW